MGDVPVKPMDAEKVLDYMDKLCPCRTSPENIPGCEQCECRPLDEDKCFACQWPGHSRESTKEIGSPEQ
jgi:hypothetical protein